jgi:hypothetical protein
MPTFCDADAGMEKIVRKGRLLRLDHSEVYKREQQVRTFKHIRDDLQTTPAPPRRLWLAGVAITAMVRMVVPMPPLWPPEAAVELQLRQHPRQPVH